MEAVMDMRTRTNEIGLKVGCALLLAALLLPGGAVHAAETILFNESAAHQCYLAALRGMDARDLEVCDAALQHQTLKRADLAATLSNRGLLLTRSGRYDEALRDHDRAVKTAPEIASLYINRSNTYSRAQRFDDAMVDLDRAVELAGVAAAAAADARAVAASGAAPTPADGAVDDPPDASGEFAAAYYNRALLRQRRGDLPAALEDAIRARDLAPERAGYRQYAQELEQLRAAPGSGQAQD